MEKTKVFLYGANGYTGKLILQQLLDRGIKPVIGGRNKEAISSLAKQYGLDYRIFSLNEPVDAEEGIRDCFLVINAAGPFKYTAKPMIMACLQTSIHYLDITGEIVVFEMAASKDNDALQAGICVMPGTGFDVVPTDCTAKFLSDLLPDATHLQLAFASVGGKVSRGTQLTAIDSLSQKGLVRENGMLVQRNLGNKAMNIPFMEHKSLYAMTIPWGDLSTAYRTTGIPNIETYMSVRPKMHQMQKWMGWLIPILNLPFLKRWLQKKVKNGPEGPNEHIRNTARAYVWGKVWNTSGREKSVRLSLPETYRLTALTTVLITEKMLAGNIKPGYQTPAGAYGADLILEIEGVQRTILDD